jgi:hypothetical protein
MLFTTAGFAPNPKPTVFPAVLPTPTPSRSRAARDQQVGAREVTAGTLDSSSRLRAGDHVDDGRLVLVHAAATDDAGRPEVAGLAPEVVDGRGSRYGT